MMMLVVFGVLFLTGLCNCDAEYYSVRCSDHEQSSATLTPSTDGVRGRYVMEWCTEVEPGPKEWNMELGYNGNNPKSCHFVSTHTTTVYTVIDDKLPNCSHVCFSQPLDLIFSACYVMLNGFNKQGGSFYSTYNISNGYSKRELLNVSYISTFIDHGDYVSAHFKMAIPASKFNVELNRVNSSYQEQVLWTKRVNEYCSSLEYEVMCKLPGLRRGTYHVILEHQEPWAKLVGIRRRYMSIDLRDPRGQPVEGATGAGAALAWACGALAALCCGAVLLLLALRCRRAALARKSVLQAWLHRVENKSAAPVETKPAAGPILLLYARECAAAEPVIDALRALLETVAPGQVYDIGSASTLALAAAGGGEWVRALMARADARVLLLQTPALHALHTPRLVTEPTGEPKLEQPLLSASVVYRAPGAGDWLLQFALRLLYHTQHLALPYRKYYLATLEGLETEALPYAVPFRRYVLPRHAHTLLRDLGDPPATPATPGPPGTDPPVTPAAPRQHLVDTLAHAAVGFLDYARANPDYLMEELLFL